MQEIYFWDKFNYALAEKAFSASVRLIDALLFFIQN